jgi:hypothetical protein
MVLTPMVSAVTKQWKEL